MKINSICVLGGGTAGFSISSMLSRYREISGSKFDIKVVYCEQIKSIGVGESSVLNVNDFFNYLGLNDKKWMKRCDATYKTVLKFTDFNLGSYFYYPLDRIPHTPERSQQLHNWYIGKEFRPDLYTPENAGTYFVPHTILAEKNKLTDNDDYNLNRNAAYHFDASKLGDVLREYSKERGVEIINDKFVEAKLNEDGSIKSLICEEGVYDADLFVDCSGFSSLLLGKTMKQEFISYGSNLINDKAIVAKIPYKDKKKELNNYTNSVALKNGWCWEIPLWDKMSVGYVHTNKFVTEKEIEKEFFDRYGEVEYKTIHYKTGRYKNGWVKNVVGVGLAYGFIEPLESTGLATTFVNCFRLIEALSKRDLNYTKLDRDLFNTTVGEYGIDFWRSVVLMHYFLSLRSDSDYWNHVTEDIDYDSNINSEFSYKSFIYKCGVIRDLYPTNEPGPMHIATGMGYSPLSKAILMTENIDKELTDGKLFDNGLKYLEDWIKDFPSTFEFLRNNIYS